MSEVDWEEEAKITAPKDDQLSSINKLVNKAVTLAHSIEEMEKALKVYKEDYFKLVMHLLPDAMAAAGTSKFKTDKGLEVSIEDVMEGNIPKEDEVKRAAAFKWLHDNGGLDIIKGEIVVPIAKGEHNFKEVIKSNLRELKADFKEQEDVHHMTLKSFVREKIRNGENVPLETLGLFAGRKAKIVGAGLDNKKKPSRKGIS